MLKPLVPKFLLDLSAPLKDVAEKTGHRESETDSSLLCALILSARPPCTVVQCVCRWLRRAHVIPSSAGALTGRVRHPPSSTTMGVATGGMAGTCPPHPVRNSGVDVPPRNHDF